LFTNLHDSAPKVATMRSLMYFSIILASLVSISCRQIANDDFRLAEVLDASNVHQIAFQCSSDERRIQLVETGDGFDVVQTVFGAVSEPSASKVLANRLICAFPADSDDIVFDCVRSAVRNEPINSVFRTRYADDPNNEILRVQVVSPTSDLQDHRTQFDFIPTQCQRHELQE